MVFTGKNAKLYIIKNSCPAGFEYIISGLKFQCAIDLATLTRKNAFQSLYESKHYRMNPKSDLKFSSASYLCMCGS